MVDVLDFEFITVDTMFFEEKESRHGNSGFTTKAFHISKNQIAF